MSLQDYAQRRYDYLAVQNVKPHGDSQLALEIFNKDTAGKICVGMQKLAQRWLLEFMTERGSMPGLPDRGCSFMTVARAGGFRTRLNVETTFSSSDMQIKRNLIAEEYEGMPADERFASAELLNATVLPGFDVNQKSGTTAVFLSMQVKITSAAGAEYSIIFPVETLP
jgi:hypothetical protein